MHIRGALTNGHDWMFLILTMNPDGPGTSYCMSEKLFVVEPTDVGNNQVTFPDIPDIIAGILTSWVC
jgi:hypothetical protein